MSNNLQLTPIIENMRFDDLIAACRSNFAILLDAYLTGANAVYFKGKPGTDGNAGLRGASLFQLTRNNLLSCYNALQLTTGFETVYSNADLLVQMLQQAINTSPDADQSAFRQCFADIAIIDQLEDLVLYDTLVIDNGFVLYIDKLDSSVYVRRSGLNLLTSSDYADVIADLIRSLIPEQSSTWHTEQSKVNGAISVSEAVPESADGAYASWNADNAMMWLSIINTVDAAERSYSPVVFCGSSYDLRSFFTNLVHSANDDLNAPSMAKSPVFAVRMRPGSDSTDSTPPTKYGIVLLDDAGGTNGRTYSGCNASIAYDNGRLWIEVEKQRANDTMSGKLFISKQMVKLWTGESGLIVLGSTGKSVLIDDGDVAVDGDATVSGSLNVNDIHMTRQDMRECIVKCDNTGRLVPASGASADPVPIGTILMWAGYNPPDYDGSNVRTWNQSDWRICDGSSLAMSEYQQLYNVLGNKYGHDATTFKLPNLCKNFVVGAAVQSPTTFGSNGEYDATLGSTGGSAEVQLLIKHLPSHSHDIPKHAHNVVAHSHYISFSTGDAGKHNHKVTVTVNESSQHTHDVMGWTYAEGKDQNNNNNDNLKHSHLVPSVGALKQGQLSDGLRAESGHENVTDAVTATPGYAHSHYVNLRSQEGGLHTHTASANCKDADDHSHSVQGYTQSATSATDFAELSTRSTGNYVPHSNVPQYIAIFYIIKVSKNN